ncbi:hypothetical protein SDC9_24037 [bioreactor metagenome]|uniref:Uncharacterized protein n=1 Tax=bioreactor metagenome TaxID=1076179 RepID=A0A644UH68_9ZZZZ
MQLKISFYDILLSLLFLMLITIFTSSYTMHSYIIFLIMLFLGLIKFIKKKLLLKTNMSIIASLFLLVWFYGFLIGVFNNKINYVVANFAGMVLYLLYFVFSSFNVSKKDIIKILILISIINVLGTLIYWIYQFINLNNILNYSMSTGQIRLYYFLNMSTYYIILIYTFSIMIMPNKYNNESYRNIFNIFNQKKYSVLFFLLALIAILLSASKGFVLGFIILISLSFLMINKSYFFKRVINKKIIYAFVFLLISLPFLFIVSYEKLFTMIFSSEDLGNQVRFAQFYVLYNDLTFFGKGLGAEVANNFDGNTYGFELSFLNIFHKFGIMAILIIIGYLMTFYYIFKRFKKNKLSSLIALSCMGYLFPSIGNPILFAPTNVMLHVCALLILDKKDE